MMGKFCSNCGAKMSGNFCSSCGNPVGDTSPDTESIVQQETLNGVTFDPIPIFAAHKGVMGRIKITTKIISITNAKPKEAATFVDDHYKDQSFMDRVAAYRTPQEEIPPLTCPACKSTNVEIERKGYGFGKGVIGVVLLGPLGALAGGIGRKDVKCLCHNCGNRFTPKISKKK